MVAVATTSSTTIHLTSGASETSRASVAVAVSSIIAIVVVGVALGVAHGVDSSRLGGLSETGSLRNGTSLGNRSARHVEDTRRAKNRSGSKRSSIGVQRGAQRLVVNNRHVVTTINRKFAAVTVGQGASRNATHAGIVVVQVLLGGVVRSAANSGTRNGLEGRHVVGREGCLQLRRGSKDTSVVDCSSGVGDALDKLLIDTLHFDRVAIGGGAATNA